MMEKIKRSLFAGIITMIPIALTVYVLQAILILIFTIGGKIAEPLNQIEALKNFAEGSFIGFDLLTSFIGLFVVSIILIIVGFFARNVLGKRVVNWVEGIFTRIPLIGMIYSTTKQIIQSISGTKNNSFQKVVFIEYPRKGVWTLGFVTKETHNDNDERFYNLFVPTTPNPTSGFFLIIPVEDVKETDISIEEGFQMIVSSGMVSGDKTPISK
ncbi:MAG: DUF502 domain-containing protein [Candidatus Neomarinimicrobiota bacterium]|nr:DUF502 domain-containing protein [Candidatus Neomarinimicrobiota bacterium]MED5451091.1 DUF502 domain-containing protein [Candidatus Neomarinimicrobiota bacterium]